MSSRVDSPKATVLGFCLAAAITPTATTEEGVLRGSGPRKDGGDGDEKVSGLDNTVCNQRETRARTVQWRMAIVLNSDVKSTHSMISGMYTHMLSRFLYPPPQHTHTGIKTTMELDSQLVVVFLKLAEKALG